MVIGKSNPTRLRIAIGVFDRIENLDAALSELSKRKIPETSMALLCTSGTREDETNAAGGSSQLGAIAKSSALFVRKGDRVERANIGPQPHDSTPLETIVRLERWIEPRLVASLESQLLDSTCLLFGIAETPEQERAICDVLIRHSVGQVQVHDFSFEAHG